MGRVAKTELFEFTTFKQVGEREFAFKYTVHFTDGTIEKFTDRLEFPFPIKSLNRTALKLLEQLHLVLGINYYKLHASHRVKVPYKLDAASAEFWNKVYRYGLGEFAYVNRLNPQKLGNFKATIEGTKSTLKPLKKFDFDARYLTGIGGGKDSLVAWELLKSLGVKQTPFIAESPSHNNILRREVVATLGGSPIIITRQPSKKLETLREEGKVYRGHTPMSVVVAFIAVFTAHVKKYDGFLVANESSSNEYNLTWRGIKVNHQWTKSQQFENAFNAYLQHLNIPITYLSVVRPMNELMITALFSRMKQYHKVFFSCNRSRLDKQGRPVRWCGECAKCASASLLLAPFLRPRELTAIIGKNMYQDKGNAALFAELAGFEGDKPFECVCTREEAAVILQHLHQDRQYKDMPVVETLYQKYEEADATDNMSELLRFRPQKAFPTNLARRLKKEVDQIFSKE